MDTREPSFSEREIMQYFILNIYVDKLNKEQCMYVYYGNPNETNNNNIIRSQKISPTTLVCQIMLQQLLA